jgi:basic membrane protein A
MKKLLTLIFAFALIMVLAGCGKKTYEIALITDKGNIDDKSFNQGSWDGVVKYAKENKITHQYIKPEEASDDGYFAAIELAIKGGAKIVVTPGYLFELAVYQAQTKYPDVKFILLDGAPHNADYSDFKTEKNTASIMYAEEESGYLAGYAAVKDGYRKLGFMGGMAVPAVQAFGYGFLQGAEDAAKELNLADGAVTVKYHYTGNFDENDTNKATAKSMYQQVEIIFACGGKVGQSVMAAAAEAEKKVIGVDTDQRYDSETVVTSAVKGLGTSVIQVLEAIYETDKWGTFSGKTYYFDATNDGVGLATTIIDVENGDAFDRFKIFDKVAYNAVYDKLVDKTVDPLREITIANADGYATAPELTTGLSLVKVVVEVR